MKKIHSNLLRFVPLLAIVGLLPFVSINDDPGIDSQKIDAVGTGHVEALLFDKDGNLIKKVENHNLLVGEGLETVWDLAFPDINLNSNATDTQFDVIGIGSGNTAPTASDTGLETTIAGCARLQDGTVTGGGTSSQVWAYISVQFSGADCEDSSVSEAILANSITGGEILGRAVFSDINLGASDTLQINYNATFADDGS